MNKQSLTSCLIALIVFTVLNMIFIKQVQAQVISPSGQEVDFHYTATFEVPLGHYESDLESAQFHASHLFGLFASPKLIKKFRLDPNLVGGLGAPRAQSRFLILSSELTSQGTVRINYENKGRMLLHKDVAKKLITEGVFQIPLPVNPFRIYDVTCTDAYYQSFSDYWYFYDVFRKGCEYLNKPPYSEKTDLYIQKTKTQKHQNSPDLNSLRGDNGNGKIFSIYLIHGFSDNKSDPEDWGRQNFNEMTNHFLEQGFSLEKIKVKTPYPYYLFSKKITLANGKEIFIQINQLLVDTAIETRSVVFANFFRDAVLEGDVIIYSGHSGLGGNLDIPLLETKVGAFEFNPRKKQIFYFDSCSSYSYYLQSFAAEKTKAKIDIMTNGLSSYFESSQMTVKIFLKYLISRDTRDIKWSTLLSNMESTLDSETYLLNVGGI